MAQPRQEVERADIAAVARNFANDARRRWNVVRSFTRATLDAIDPNDDPDADPLTFPALATLAVAITFSTYWYLRWKYQPMQDLGHHIALSAVVADYGRPHSLYTSLYEPIDPFAANSLMYQVAGRIGRFTGVTNAVRGCVAFYVAGMPLATLYTLRVFGRSPWPAVLAVPLAYNMIFLAGFANMLFAGPFMLLSIAFYYRALDVPGWKRTLLAGVVIALLFLGHAHLFLWTGALLILMSFGFLAWELTRTGITLKERAKSIAKRTAVAVGAVTPSLLIFAHWYKRTFGAGRTEGNVMAATEGWHNHFGAYFKTVQGSFDTFTGAFAMFASTHEDFDNLLMLMLAIIFCFSLTRLHRYRRPPFLELAFGVTALSYFFLPDGLAGHDVLAARQIPIALWLVPAMLSPVPARVSRLARIAAILPILYVTGIMLRSWHTELVKFETQEVAGLNEVLRSAPPRLRLHYVKLEQSSAFFAWRSFMHIDKYYMGDSFGQVPDTPGILSTSAIRYRSDVDIHRFGNHSAEWSNSLEIWKNFDLVLVRRWHPTPAELAAAQKHGVLLRKVGDWELWRSREATPIVY